MIKIKSYIKAVPDTFKPTIEKTINNNYKLDYLQQIFNKYPNACLFLYANFKKVSILTYGSGIDMFDYPEYDTIKYLVAYSPDNIYNNLSVKLGCDFYRADFELNKLSNHYKIKKGQLYNMLLGFSGKYSNRSEADSNYAFIRLKDLTMKLNIKNSNILSKKVKQTILADFDEDYLNEVYTECFDSYLVYNKIMNKLVLITQSKALNSKSGTVYNTFADYITSLLKSVNFDLNKYAELQGVNVKEITNKTINPEPDKLAKVKAWLPETNNTYIWLDNLVSDSISNKKLAC